MFDRRLQLLAEMRWLNLLQLKAGCLESLPRGVDIPAAGVSTLSVLATGAPDALPLIDAKRREVFTLVDGEPAEEKRSANAAG